MRLTPTSRELSAHHRRQGVRVHLEGGMMLVSADGGLTAHDRACVLANRGGPPAASAREVGRLKPEQATFFERERSAQ